MNNNSVENYENRYYSEYDSTCKDSRGYNGIYRIIDKTTGEVLTSVDTYVEADDKVKMLNKKDKMEKGIRVIDLIEIPTSYRDGCKKEVEVVAPTIHK